ncbi:MAG: transposase [Planctomycetes bacterium]|nr:transposase [Planctomycetota bacterium]
MDSEALEFLREHCERFGFNVLGYCLMTNHIHLVGTPALEDSPAKAIGLARVAQFGKIRGNFRGETGCESAVALSSGVVRISNPVVVRT